MEQGRIIAGRYCLTRELARGGMGAVWEARDHHQGELVAIKLQPSSTDRMAALRFEREVMALHRLRNPYVVRILDSGHQPGWSFIVMELLQGETLRQHLGRRGRLRPSEAARVVEQVAKGLEAVHALKIVHRDIKPSNVFLAGAPSLETIKLIDFGIAKRDVANPEEATHSGIVGSPAYMSPEQTRGERVDSRTDLWSLAVVAFTLLVGAEPFTQSSLPATLSCIGTGKPRRELDPALPAALGAFFKVAFARAPEQRFQTASALAESFSLACAGIAQVGVGRVEATAPQRELRPAGNDARWVHRAGATALAASAMFAAGALFAYTQPFRRETQPPSRARAQQPAPRLDTVPTPPGPGSSGSSSEMESALYAAAPSPASARSRPARIERSRRARELANATSDVPAAASAHAVGTSQTFPPLESPGPAEPASALDPLDRRF